MHNCDYHRVLVSDVAAFQADGWRVANAHVHLEAIDRAWVWMVRDVSYTEGREEEHR